MEEPESAGEGHSKAPPRTMMDLLDLPDAERDLVQFLLRQGETDLSALAAHSGQEPAALRQTLEGLMEQGFLGRGEGESWRALLAPKRARLSSRNLWAALEE